MILIIFVRQTQIIHIFQAKLAKITILGIPTIIILGFCRVKHDFLNCNFLIFSGPFEVNLYTILKQTLCSLIRYAWIWGTIGYLLRIRMSKMAFLVVNLTLFWNSWLRLADKTLKFDHLASDFAKMHKVNPFSIHFYYSNLLLTQFPKIFIAFLLEHCVV